MNKYLSYILFIIVGLIIGWLIFSDDSKSSSPTNPNIDASAHSHIGTSSNQQVWTCSMHPQIMQPEPGDCPICGMELIPAESNMEGLAMNEIKMTKNAMALANIETTIIGNMDTDTFESNISLSGRIKVNEEAESVQASYFDGRLERLNVAYEGQEVKKGQLLATIYAPNLVAAQQELISSLSLKESQPALYKAVRNKLKLWKLTEGQINDIEETREVKEYFPVYATVSGTVAEKIVAEGDYVKQGQPLLKLVNLGSVWAEFDAYENQISALKKGQKITLTTNVYPNKEFEAVMSFIDPILNEGARTVAVRATLNNQKGMLKPGMFVKGNVKGSIGVNVSELTVPASAVMWTGERSVVYIKMNANDPVFRMKEVVLGNRNGDVFIVKSGLKNGDEVVTNGAFTVDAAAQLQGRKSMMNQETEENASYGAKENMKMVFPVVFQDKFKSSLPFYFKIKDALINGNSENASENANNLLKNLEAIQESGLHSMEKLHFSKIKESMAVIYKKDDLVAQRNEFIALNENMVPILMNIGELDGAVYIQKCPMANNNRGAFWLSLEKEIKNPYYGDQMLTCGSIIDSIQ